MLGSWPGGPSQHPINLCSGQGGLARAPGGHGLQRGISKVGRSPYPSPTGGNEVGPRVPTWLSPGQDLAASSDLRAPVLILRALPGGCGTVASRPPGNPGPSPNPSSASAPLPCRKDKLLQFSPSLEGECPGTQGWGQGRGGTGTEQEAFPEERRCELGWEARRGWPSRGRGRRAGVRA